MQVWHETTFSNLFKFIEEPEVIAYEVNNQLEKVKVNLKEIAPMGQNAVYFSNNASYIHGKRNQSAQKKMFDDVYYVILSDVVTGKMSNKMII